MNASAEIRQRILDAKGTFAANDNISDYLRLGDLDRIKREVKDHMYGILRALVIDVVNDPNSRETAERVARMYVDEVFAGRYQKPPRITEFPNTKDLDEIYTLGPITIRSACSHHLVPVLGRAWVGVIPNDRIIGISKFTRLVRWVLERPQIQEEAVIQLADEIERRIEPIGLAVVLQARHWCMAWRGVKDPDTLMGSSVMRGAFRTEPSARAEFMAIIKGQGYGV